LALISWTDDDLVFSAFHQMFCACRFYWSLEDDGDDGGEVGNITEEVACTVIDSWVKVSFRRRTDYV